MCPPCEKLVLRGSKGVVAPPNMPADVVKRLSEALQKSLARADVKAKLEASGSTVSFSTPAEFAALIRNENERWSKVIKAANVKLD
jgi:tripartite-type tricarboxylate transporter receptor subunit TctC